MRALIVDPEVEGGLRLGEAPEPEPRPDQVLVSVQHLALNFGDLNGARSRPAGFVPGWDASGVILEPAASGNGPAVGTRVVTTMGTQGGWAERRVVDLDELAVVPDNIDLGEASTLPVAGVTALRASGVQARSSAGGSSSPAQPVASAASLCNSRHSLARTSSRASARPPAAKASANSARPRWSSVSRV